MTRKNDFSRINSISFISDKIYSSLILLFFNFYLFVHFADKVSRDVTIHHTEECESHVLMMTQSQR
jgi:hypothetical protein